MLSVVIPVYNEGAVLEKTASVIRGVLSDAAIGCELIFVDDGSKDATWEKITALSASGGIRGLHFSRNFGKEAAILAGLAAAKGDCCVVIDGDLQHPPEKIVEMYRLWEQGYEIVEGQKATRGAESHAHGLAARAFYSLISRATGIDMRTPLTSSCSTGRRSTFSSICASGTPFSARFPRGSALKR